MISAIAIIAAYLLGSIPTGPIIVRRLRPGVDLRAVGSGNIGATNVGRVLGKRWGVFTMLCDCLKGLAAVLFARWIGVSAAVAAIAGTAAFLGHIYPVFLKFRGGKGVATAFGALLGLAPLLALVAFFLWAGVAAIARNIGVGSLSAALALPVLAVGLAPEGDYRVPVMAIGVVMSVFVFYTHTDNIRGIIRGEIKPGSSGENG